MANYRMPLVLGGQVLAGADLGDGTVAFELPMVGKVVLPISSLSVVHPEEPADGSFVTVRTPDAWHVFHRDDDAATIDEGSPDRAWWHHDTQQWISWGQVSEFGVPITLVRKSGSARGICSGCHAPRALNVDGTIRSHDIDRTRCEGSGRRPLKVVA